MSISTSDVPPNLPAPHPWAKHLPTCGRILRAVGIATSFAGVVYLYTHMLVTDAKYQQALAAQLSIRSDLNRAQDEYTALKTEVDILKSSVLTFRTSSQSAHDTTHQQLKEVGDKLDEVMHRLGGKPE